MSASIDFTSFNRYRDNAARFGEYLSRERQLIQGVVTKANIKVD